MFKLLRSPLAVLLGLALLMVAFNPSRTDHQLKIKEAWCEENPVACTLGLANAGQHFIKYSSFGVFSIAEFDGKPVSIGVLGVVIARNPEVKLI